MSEPVKCVLNCSCRKKNIQLLTQIQRLTGELIELEHKAKEFKIHTFYVAFFNPDIDCYEKYSINMDFKDAKTFLQRVRERLPKKSWTVLAVINTDGD